jgi:D-beta-D-heptose 7-phosphate kinase/D-beta-D-heptose 1-phosphate adenosyltransferase
MTPPRLTVEDATRLTRKFTECTVLVVGDVMLDQYVWGEAGRISPEAPVPIVEVLRESLRLGGAANVARNIASLGGTPVLLSAAGVDSRADELRTLLEDQGIAAEELLEDPGRPTTLKTRIIASRQQVVRIDRESQAPLAGKIREKFIARLLELLARVDGVIVSDYGKGMIDLELMEMLGRAAREEGVFVAVDPKESHFYQYKHVSAVTPNVHEASRAARILIRDLESLEEAGRRLLAELTCECVLVTRGPDGMSVFRTDVPTTHIPVMAREVYDVTGAGDTVIATFTLARVAGATFEQAAVLSNAAAAVVVGELGTAAVTPELLWEAVAAGFPVQERT